MGLTVDEGTRQTLLGESDEDGGSGGPDDAWFWNKELTAFVALNAGHVAACFRGTLLTKLFSSECAKNTNFLLRRRINWY